MDQSRESTPRYPDRLSVWSGPVLSGLLALAVVAMLARPPQLGLILTAPLVIQLHMVGAVAALGIGIVLLRGVKGTSRHKTLGWGWVLAMALVAVSSLFIREINRGDFGPIHLLSGWVMIALPIAIVAIRRRNVRLHARFMTGMFVGGLIIAGLFTFLPGRLMYQVFLG